MSQPNSIHSRPVRVLGGLPVVAHLFRFAFGELYMQLHWNGGGALPLSATRRIPQRKWDDIEADLIRDYKATLE